MDKATGDAIILLRLGINGLSLAPSLADVVLMNAVAHLEGRPADGPSTVDEVRRAFCNRGVVEVRLGSAVSK